MNNVRILNRAGISKETMERGNHESRTVATPACPEGAGRLALSGALSYRQAEQLFGTAVALIIMLFIKLVKSFCDDQKRA